MICRTKDIYAYVTYSTNQEVANKSNLFVLLNVKMAVKQNKSYK